MISPSLTFGILVASLCGALAHLILGGGGRLLILYIAAAWIGFALGQAIGDVTGGHLFVIGMTNVFAGVIGAWSAVLIAAFLSWPRKSQDSRRRPDGA
jgi:hypothetical protein